MSLEKIFGPKLLQSLKENRFRGYLLIHGLVVVTVLFLFRTITERKVAALVAGTLFLIAPAFVIWSEVRLGKAYQRLSTWGALLFLVVSAIPIFSLRVLYWSEPFESLTVFGITAAQLHKTSNYLFIVLLLCFVFDSILKKLKRK